MPSYVITEKCDGCKGQDRTACMYICPNDLMVWDTDMQKSVYAFSTSWAIRANRRIFEVKKLSLCLAKFILSVRRIYFGDHGVSSVDFCYLIDGRVDMLNFGISFVNE